MKIIVPAIIIGIVGGALDAYTDLHKIWCFIIGLAAFFFFLFIKSAIKATLIMLKTKGAKKIWLDQDNNIVKSE